MKFDPARVVELADRFDSPRPLGSQGARDAAATVAEAFRRDGLTPLIPEFPPSNPWIVAALWIGFVALLVAVAHRAAPELPLWLDAAVPLASSFAVAWVVRRNSRDKESMTVLAARPSTSEPRARVVLVTPLLTRPPRWVDALHLVGLLAVALPVVLMLLLMRVGFDGWAVRARPGVGLGLVAAVWSGLALMIVFSLVGRAARPIQGDNRSGLAMLIELARTWPATLGGAVDALFATTPFPGQLTRHLGSRLDDGLPTLILTLDAPGVGQEIRLAGRGEAGQIATQAAQDLWLPHRVVGRALLDLRPSFLDGSSPSCVALLGTRDDSPINPALLAATAQLITEIAMRWAKQAGPAPDE
jgi:hypothetical protein